MRSLVQQELILIVDDDPVILMALRGLLASWGYSTAACSGATDTERLIQRGVLPRLAILDIDLADRLSGVELSKHILAPLEVPVIFHSSHFEPRTCAEVRSLENTMGLCAKAAGPVTLRSMVEAVEQILTLQSTIQEMSAYTPPSDPTLDTRRCCGRFGFRPHGL